MPVLSRPFRRALAGPSVAVLLLAGCDSLDDANRAAGGRTDLVNDLASQLDRAATLTWSAEYQLPGGRTGTIAQAQRPARSAYVYPGGKLTVAPDAIAECETGGRPTCTLSAPARSDGRPALTTYAGVGRHGLIAPPVVIGLLNDAALDPTAEITQTDTTVAGRHATCVRVRNLTHAAASSFDVCLTGDGVLGKFVGVVDGNPVDLSLTGYRVGVDAEVFTLPAGAGVTDRRTGAR
ncbi:hypothetical protein [Micromonospora zhanjiangensis]|uniref:Lipoprotein n=1 Tax=Micromonospora zhanjiangensis TaxID=1522057 RepID=A0ABV8KT18_9ACTN